MGKIVDGIEHVDVDELKQKVGNANDDTLLIDVREHEEYEEAHIPGVPLVPMSEIAEVVDQFDKDKNYVLICRSGRRSLEVSKFFKQNGIENVYNYEGGMLAWNGDVKNGPEHVPTAYDSQTLRKKG